MKAKGGQSCRGVQPSVLHCDILEGKATYHFQANDGKEFRWSRFSAAIGFVRRDSWCDGSYGPLPHTLFQR
jgi:hypothetical protein